MASTARRDGNFRAGSCTAAISAVTVGSNADGGTAAASPSSGSAMNAESGVTPIEASQLVELLPRLAEVGGVGIVEGTDLGVRDEVHGTACRAEQQQRLALALAQLGAETRIADRRDQAVAKASSARMHLACGFLDVGRMAGEQQALRERGLRELRPRMCDQHAPCIGLMRVQRPDLLVRVLSRPGPMALMAATRAAE